MDCIEIEGRKIGYGEPCFVIAEAGVNHNGDVELAKRLIEAAVSANADAVKFQTFKAEEVVTAGAPKAAYQMETTGADGSQLDMLKSMELSFNDFRELHSYCKQRGILFISTPFDEKSVDFLYELGSPVYKIGSGELTNWPFLKYIGRKGKPIILSTGMSYLSEVDEAVRVIRDAGCAHLVLLHCVSNYPANPADINLRAMNTMGNAFGVSVGYSDHTPGIEVAIAAVALGACIIEKHFTLDRHLRGPDHRASLEPGELANLVRGIRLVETAIGYGLKEPADSESNIAAVARRSLVAACDIPAGRILMEELIAVKRPGTGLSPRMLPCLVGRTVKEDIKAGALIGLEMLV